MKRRAIMAGAALMAASTAGRAKEKPPAKNLEPTPELQPVYFNDKNLVALAGVGLIGSRSIWGLTSNGTETLLKVGRLQNPTLR